MGVVGGALIGAILIVAIEQSGYLGTFTIAGAVLGGLIGYSRGQERALAS